ncbi:hypothetical protein L211DRAFT_857978 [Terfezia boudieri ATCC MYA-4762]|uniref:Uncharacterized protein n=1 Tax=Terfezia boudieri ATCC MYA-4762 TaxID=1051890 RepID=A0A3N4LMW9_9PEZI|nr:hypothetical protein L211DRAFT_857978 [Terfezia boudieri ATCC MYA-4762]
MTGNQLDLNHLWTQVQELSAILQVNRDQAQGLVRRADEIRGRVANGEGGSFLRDVNGELNGAREVELERELAAVKEENAALRADNEDLNNVLMEYASTLEKVLDGLRVYAHEHTITTINIHQSYTAQLANERQANAILRQNEADSQGRLSAMAMLLRQAYDAQTNNVDADTVIEGLKYENAALREALGLPKETAALAEARVVWHLHMGYPI